MLPKRILIAVGLLGIAQSLYFYTKLPDKVAIHFGSSGIPNNWVSNETNLVIGVCLHALLLSFFLVIPFLINKLPIRFVNLPNKEYWLSKERADTTVSLIGGFLYILGIAFIIFFIILGYFTFHANMSTPVILNESAVWGIAVCLLLFTVGWLFLFYRKFTNVY
jgi:uncharacterized membrane protein